MKIRSGFVSNSSTTSFTIWGMRAEWDDLKDEIKENFENDSQKWYNYTDRYTEHEELEIHWDNRSFESIVYMGRSLSRMADDEIYGEFKKKTEKELEKMFKKVKCHIVDVAYYDG